MNDYISLSAQKAKLPRWSIGRTAHESQINAIKSMDDDELSYLRPENAHSHLRRKWLVKRIHSRRCTLIREVSCRPRRATLYMRCWFLPALTHIAKAAAAMRNIWFADDELYDDDDEYFLYNARPSHLPAYRSIDFFGCLHTTAWEMIELRWRRALSRFLPCRRQHYYKACERYLKLRCLSYWFSSLSFRHAYNAIQPHTVDFYCLDIITMPASFIIYLSAQILRRCFVIDIRLCYAASLIWPAPSRRTSPEKAGTGASQAWSSFTSTSWLLHFSMLTWPRHKPSMHYLRLLSPFRCRARQRNSFSPISPCYKVDAIFAASQAIREYSIFKACLLYVSFSSIDRAHLYCTTFIGSRPGRPSFRWSSIHTYFLDADRANSRHYAGYYSFYWHAKASLPASPRELRAGGRRGHFDAFRHRLPPNYIGSQLYLFNFSLHWHCLSSYDVLDANAPRTPLSTAADTPTADAHTCLYTHFSTWILDTLYAEYRCRNVKLRCFLF